MELSKRLTAVAGLVTEGASVADIGTDHGYVPIYLVKNNIAVKAIAMDINRGPLERARMHIIGHGLKGKIETRLSDGLDKIRPGEVDTIIAAGMGGGLVIKILEEGKEVVKSLDVCILQPQSEIEKVRRYLNKHHLVIDAEDMVEEEYKYYPMMRVVHGEPEVYEEYEYLYGKRLLEMRHPVLKKYLLREREIQESIVRQLSARKESVSAKERLKEMETEIALNRQALECYE
ncbi:MAG: tRNA (adenine(22)-N(1))-methyltransferase [Lachnospiraceae bacterium]